MSSEKNGSNEEAPERVLTVPESLAGVRLDKALREMLPELSRAYLRDLVKERQVIVRGRVEHRPRYLCQAGDEVRVRLVPRVAEDDGPLPPSFRVIFHDDAILVISKPAGLAAHRNENVTRGTVADYAQRDFGLLPSLQGERRPGIVHRLDKDTSGVMVLARTPEAFHHLRSQFAARTVGKEYHAVVFGSPRFESEWIERAIARDVVHPDRMAVVSEGGRESSTFVEVIERFPEITYVRCKPKTGRTHQIRVHLASMGHSIVGDHVYRARRGRHEIPAGAPPVTRQLLHARVLEITHPTTGERVRFEAELPADFEAFLRFLRARRR